MRSRYKLLSILLACNLALVPGLPAQSSSNLESSSTRLIWKVSETWGWGQNQVVLNHKVGSKWRDEVAWCREFGSNAKADLPVGASCDLSKYKGELNVNFSQLYAPICEENSRFCIQGVSAKLPDGTEVEGVFQSYSHPLKAVPANNSLGNPRGESVGIWQIPGLQNSLGNDFYHVFISINGGAALTDGKVTKKFNYSDAEYQFGIRPYSPNTPDWGQWNYCESCMSLPSDVEFRLDAILPKSLRNWFAGRISAPSIEFDELSATTNKVSISGKPIEIPGFSAELPAKSATKEIQALYPACTGVEEQCYGLVSNLASSSDWRWLNAWRVPSGDSISNTRFAWNIRSLLVDPRKFNFWKFQKCAPKNSPSGILSTNALIFDGQMPILSAGDFSYRVAGLHFYPDKKTPFLGVYEVSINKDLATCLLGLPKVPVSAKVSVVDADGKQVVATSTVGTSKGLVNIRAYNFGFSEKTVKFTLSAPGFQLCTKAASSKYVAGTRCPVGFKKK